MEQLRHPVTLKPGMSVCNMWAQEIRKQGKNRKKWEHSPCSMMHFPRWWSWLKNVHLCPHWSFLPACCCSVSTHLFQDSLGAAQWATSWKPPRKESKLQKVSTTTRLESYDMKAGMNGKERKFMNQLWSQRRSMELHWERERAALWKSSMDSEWVRKWETASKETVFYCLQGNMILCTLLSAKQKCSEEKKLTNFF